MSMHRISCAVVLVLVWPTIVRAQGLDDASLAPSGPSQPEETSEEQPPPPKTTQPVRFGRQGQWALSGGTYLQGLFTNASASSYSSRLIDGEISVDHFVVDRVSLGGFVYGGFDEFKGYEPLGLTDDTRTTIGFGARIGVDLPIGSVLSLWTRVGVSWGHEDRTIEGGVPGGAKIDDSTHHVALNASSLLLVHPAEHFFFGLGPSLYTELTHPMQDGTENKLTTVGVTSTVGGWF